MAEYKEAFTLFDRNGEGFIPTRELGYAMRAVGKYMSEVELRVSASHGMHQYNEDLKIIESICGCRHNVAHARPCRTSQTRWATRSTSHST